MTHLLLDMAAAESLKSSSAKDSLAVAKFAMENSESFSFSGHVEDLIKDDTPKVRDVMSYFIFLYTSIFFDYGADISFSASRELTFSRRRARSILSASKDMYVNRLGEYEPGGDHFEKAALAALDRLEISNELHRTIVYAVLVVYKERGTVTFKLPTPRLLPIISGSNYRLSFSHPQLELLKISNEGIDNFSDMPLFWRWMHVAHGEFIDTISSAYQDCLKGGEKTSHLEASSFIVTALKTCMATLMASAQRLSIRPSISSSEARVAVARNNMISIVSNILMLNGNRFVERGRRHMHFQCKIIEDYIVMDSSHCASFFGNIFRIVEKETSRDQYEFRRIMGNIISGIDDVVLQEFSRADFFKYLNPRSTDRASYEAYSVESENDEEPEELPNLDELDDSDSTTSELDTKEVSEKNADTEEESENSDDNYIASESPQADKEEVPSRQAISIQADPVRLEDVLYKRAVLRLCEVLETTPTADQEKVTTLRNWCTMWLWLACTENTQELIKQLGFEQFLVNVQHPE